MGINRARRVHGPRVMPKIARTITEKSKKVFMNIQWGKKGKEKMSLQGREMSQKALDNQNSLVLKISDLAKRIFQYTSSL